MDTVRAAVETYRQLTAVVNTPQYVGFLAVAEPLAATLDPAAGSRSDGATLEPAALPFRQPAPDAEPLVVLEGVLQALGADLAPNADLLGFPGGAALLREERLRVSLGAEGTLLPALLLREAEHLSEVQYIRRLCGVEVDPQIGHGALLLP
jgi:hypothetical protein